MNKSVHAIVIAILILLVNCTQTEISQWRGPERNGIYQDKNLLTSWPEGGPPLLWKYENLGVGYSSPVITSNKVYVIGTIDSISYVFNFDKSGKLLWKKILGREWTTNFPGSRSTPTICDGLGYYVNGLGVLYCFNAENGTILWSKNYVKEFDGRSPGWGFLDNPIVDGNKLYCTPSGIEKNVIALNRITGELIWKCKGNSEGSRYYTLPILIESEDRKFFITQPGESTIMIETKNGELVWKFETPRSDNSCHGTPFYRNGYLFILPSATSGSLLLKISDNGKSVKEVWRSPVLITNMSNPVVLGDRIYCGGKGNKLYCLEWNSGKVLFSESFPNESILISAENLLYCYDTKGNFTLLRSLEDKFEKLGSFKVKGGTDFHYSHPVIKDGKLYIRHDNSLFVYNISK